MLFSRLVQFLRNPINGALIFSVLRKQYFGKCISSEELNFYSLLQERN